ncbi:MAG: 16S rRNA (uracil(1498)-N(3))-methyltransferase [Candidatus Methylomirabilia bacterium]
MNLILLLPDEIDNTGRVRLRGRRLRHVLAVHRAAVGDELRVGLLGGDLGAGRVVLLTPDVLELEIRLESSPPPPLPLSLILALPRPKALRRVLRTASSMGVKRIVLLNARRVEKSYWQSPYLERAAMNEQLLLGLEQARDTLLPEILIRPLFKPFVEDELPELIRNTLPLVAHPAARAQCPRNTNRAVTLAVGPEGGFIPYEVEKFAGCGFLPVRLGERILSTETAVPALLARLF